MPIFKVVLIFPINNNGFNNPSFDKVFLQQTLSK